MKLLRAILAAGLCLSLIGAADAVCRAPAMQGRSCCSAESCGRAARKPRPRPNATCELRCHSPIIAARQTSAPMRTASRVLAHRPALMPALGRLLPPPASPAVSYRSPPPGGVSDRSPPPR